MGEINILECMGHFIILEFKTPTILHIVDAQGPTPATPSKTHYSVGVNGVLKRTRDKTVGFCRAFYAPQPDIDITDDEEVEDEDEE